MTRSSILCCCLLILLLWLPAALGTEKIACPESVQVAEPRLVTPVEGWKAIVEKAVHQPSGVTFYDGPGRGRVAGPRSRHQDAKDADGPVAIRRQVATRLLDRLPLFRHLAHARPRAAQGPGPVLRHLQKRRADRQPASDRSHLLQVTIALELTTQGHNSLNPTSNPLRLGRVSSAKDVSFMRQLKLQAQWKLSDR